VKSSKKCFELRVLKEKGCKKADIFLKRPINIEK
jgi:hypothetical protein